MEPTTTHHLPRRLATETGNAPQDPNPPGQATANQITANLTQSNRHTAGAGPRSRSSHRAPPQLSWAPRQRRDPSPSAGDRSLRRPMQCSTAHLSLSRLTTPSCSSPVAPFPSCLGVRGWTVTTGLARPGSPLRLSPQWGWWKPEMNSGGNAADACSARSPSHRASGQYARRRLLYSLFAGGAD
ncbi:hypothetical protein E2562_012464 [Oryza meyeriana var. granulata]|uniref:Uncharacterized protein n=1 Tax=Oryza meyeriana var. granulata TaxID=110450 RepID=A0A6G1C5K3_9ORYZ|nr:hypothetical protein E2562_012464 [Oryza meyeriana var. granulata]